VVSSPLAPGLSSLPVPDFSAQAVLVLPAVHSALEVLARSGWLSQISGVDKSLLHDLETHTINTNHLPSGNWVECALASHKSCRQEVIGLADKALV